MGEYTSKYTGEQIDNLLGQVENGGVGGSYATALWEGTLTELNTAVALIDSVENYDFILVEAMITGNNKNAAIETRLIDVSTIGYTGSTSVAEPCYNIYSSAGSITVYYRILFAFLDATSLFLVNKSVGGSSWDNPRITKITGIKLGGGIVAI